MKKSILTLAVLASMSSLAVTAAETTDAPDMSDPTAVYTTVGLSYGNAGLDFKGMLMLSSTETQKTGVIFEAMNMLNEDADAINPLTNDEVSARSYRLRWGTINTTNGLGWSVDAINAEHPFFGDMTVVQTGPNVTIPIGDNFLIWPIAYVGAVVTGNNTSDLAAQLPPMIGGALEGPLKMSSGGIDVPSFILTGMVYARYAFTDQLWALGSYSYTTDIQGKSWSDDVLDGGLQMANSKYDLTIGYQLTPTQNITLIYSGDDGEGSDDSYAVGYNYAF